MECKACQFVVIYIEVCNVCIVYVHSTTPRMYRACIYLGVHDHRVCHNIRREALDIAYECLASEVIKTPIANKKIIEKNPTIVMATSKQFLVDYYLESPSQV